MNTNNDVLIVDDDPIAQSIYKSYFASIGVHRTHSALTGKQGLQLLDRTETRSNPSGPGRRGPPTSDDQSHRLLPGSRRLCPAPYGLET